MPVVYFFPNFKSVILIKLKYWIILITTKFDSCLFLIWLCLLKNYCIILLKLIITIVARLYIDPKNSNNCTVGWIYFYSKSFKKMFLKKSLWFSLVFKFSKLKANVKYLKDYSIHDHRAVSAGIMVVVLALKIIL